MRLFRRRRRRPSSPSPDGLARAATCNFTLDTRRTPRRVRLIIVILVGER